MEDLIVDRPFDDFRVAITDPTYFFGRTNILKDMQRSPFQVRILLGGRRTGKTSTLRAIEWSLLNPDKPGPAFPVFISLEVEQPENPDNLRYILIIRLREAIDRWKTVPGTGLREKYRQFLRQIASSEVSAGFVKFSISNPDRERKLAHDDFRQALLQSVKELQEWQFDGVCFLLDEAEFIVRRSWANDAWSYFRGLKDTDTAIKPFLGLLLSGYRDVKEYEQRIGSSLLNIARIDWLNTLNDAETKLLIYHRCMEEAVTLSEQDITFVLELAGGHPYLTQQMLNSIFNNLKHKATNSLDILIRKLVRQHDRDFSAWWNLNGKSDGFSNVERTVYRQLVKCREGTSENLAENIDLSPGKVRDSLEVISGTGIVQQVDFERYRIGAKLFETWVAQQELDIREVNPSG